MTRSDPIREERESRPVRRPHRRPVAPRPARERGRLPVTLDQVEVARLERSDVGHGGVQRERDAGPVRRERELRRRPHVEQATRGRGASFVDLAHPLTAPDDSRSTSPNGYDRSTIPFGPVGHRNGLGGSRYLSQPPWGEGGIARRCGPAHAAPCPSGPSLSMEEGHMGSRPRPRAGAPSHSSTEGGDRRFVRIDGLERDGNPELHRRALSGKAVDPASAPRKLRTLTHRGETDMPFLGPCHVFGAESNTVVDHQHEEGPIPLLERDRPRSWLASACACSPAPPARSGRGSIAARREALRRTDR